MDTEDVLLKAVMKLSRKYKDKKFWPSAAVTAMWETISKIKDQFPDNVIAPYIDHG